MLPIVSFRGVSKRFGRLKVLDCLNLDVAPYEKLAIIGPSGSGKSTVLRLLMTLESVDEGEILVDGDSLTHMERGGVRVTADLRHQRQIRSKIGMVFQQFNLFPRMTALENCAEAPRVVLRLDRREAEQRALELLGMVGLGDKLNAYPAQLSGGQQQRVAIARALAMRPRILLLDEITSALDPELVGEVLGVIRALAEAHELTMIMVTHQMDFAREFADRVCFFCEGRVLEHGRPDDFFASPAEERTRSFLNAVIASR